MSMGYERSGLEVVPQASWEPLYGGATVIRCRTCEGYSDPTATHSLCTTTGVVKCGYAGACRIKEPSGRSNRRAGTGYVPRALPTWATDAGLDGHDIARHQQETADAFEPTLGAGEES